MLDIYLTPASISSPEWEGARQWQDRAWSGVFQALEKRVND
jgi:hypothetical protein